MSDSTASGNIYEQGDASDAEWARLKALSFPTECSLDLIGDLTGRTLLDVGAGPSTLLGEGVTAGGGSYVALDVSPDAVAAQRQHGHDAQVGKINEIPYDDHSFDIAHARFVLPHLANAQQRIEAIRELVRVSNDTVVLMDYIGSSVGGTPAVEQFKEAVLQIGAHPNIPFVALYEDFIVQEATAAAGDGASISVKRFDAPAGDSYRSMLMAGESLMAKIAKGVPEIAEKILQANESLREEQENNPKPFSMPSIIGVTLQKQRPNKQKE